MEKTEILKFRVTPEEKEILEEKAYGSYRTMSRYLRDCALDKEIIVVTGADAIADELRRIGNNLVITTGRAGGLHSPLRA